MAVKIKIDKTTHKKYRFVRKGFVAALLTALVIVSLSLAQSEAGLDHSRARVIRTNLGSVLTPESNEAPAAIALNYFRSRGRSEDVLSTLRTTGLTEGARGVSHVRMEQQIDGVSIYGAYVKAAVTSNGELIQLIDRTFDVKNVRPSRIEASEALNAAMANLYPAESTAFRSTGARENTTSFDGGRFFYNEPTVTAVVLPLEDGSMARGWVVQTWTAKSNELYHTVVSGNGRVLFVESRTANDSYNVFTEDPGKGSQTVVTGANWLSPVSQNTINITGPNVHAYLDANANNAPDSGGTAVTNGSFLTAVDLGVAPTTTGNREVAIQNLFYLNNITHDVLKGYGFDAGAGNFEVNDPVNAEAQDGGGVDNANFATPSDGSSPRMQMYLWTGFSPTAKVTGSGFDYQAMAAAFGPALTAAGTSGSTQVMSPANGCSAAAAGSLAGKIAIIARGECDFTVKVMNAQTAGAISAIITNNVEGNPITPGGNNRKIKIPSGMISLSDGESLRAASSGTSATLRSFSGSALQIDGDLDSDIVFHEYGHGLTWRMIGGMSGKLAGAIGEGAADVNAFLINGDDRIGEYAYSNSVGIRRYPYTAYPLTYSAVDGGEVHNDGEVYAAAMWRVLENYQAANLFAEDLHADFVDGMSYTPSTPAFEDMRDGMLQSVSGTGRECLIWRGFAASGIGVGADGKLDRRGRVVITESFIVPAECQ